MTSIRRPPRPLLAETVSVVIIIIVIPIAAVVVEVGIIIVGVFTSMSSFSASCRCCCHCRSRRSRPHCNRRYGHQRKRKGLLSSALATLRHRKLSGHSTPSGHCFTVSLFLVTVTVSLSLNTILVFFLMSLPLFCPKFTNCTRQFTRVNFCIRCVLLLGTQRTILLSPDSVCVNVSQKSCTFSTQFSPQLRFYLPRVPLFTTMCFFPLQIIAEWPAALPNMIIGHLCPNCLRNWKALEGMGKEGV